MTAPVVATTAGRVRGSAHAGTSVFRGIPYAAPPVGERRFAPPVAPPSWEGERDATRFGPAAVQAPSSLEQMMGGAVTDTSEDCLTLNVWAPEGAARVPAPGLPVMVWIHGGAFVTGTGSMVWYDGVRLSARGVVVVTLNYRLGALGFLHLDGIFDGGEGTGNLGLADQVAALGWVRDNVAAFGGDPGNVTVFGESAGAMSIATLLATPSASGLFHRAILQSGAANFVTGADAADATARKFLAEVGVDPADGIAALRQVPVTELLAAQERVSASLSFDDGLAFTPVVDGVVVPERPATVIAAGGAAGVDVIIGTTTEELKMFLLLEPELAAMDQAALEARTDETFVPRGHQPGAALATYRRRLPDGSTQELLSAVATDHTFRVPAIELAESQAAHNPRTYMYLFAHRSPAFGGLLGACHALEIPFVWDNLGRPGAAMFAGEATPELEALATAMADAWVAFTRSGTPSANGLPDWPVYDTERRATLWFEPGANRVVDDPWGDERRLWTR